LAEDKLAYNLVWYSNYANPDELADILTDTSGTKHRYTMPYGKMRPEIKSQQRGRATAWLPPQLAEVFQNIDNPFAQVITDSLTTKSVFMDGKVLLVGDAVAGMRPHAACGAIQAALHALLLKDVFQEKPVLSLEEWEKTTVGWSTTMQKISAQMGQLSQFGDHPMADNSEALMG
jgi:2-polyprenyl-6-methoxyphenol hydroxylase-like FAD-dependent oxidoreductase